MKRIKGTDNVNVHICFRRQWIMKEGLGKGQDSLSIGLRCL